MAKTVFSDLSAQELKAKSLDLRQELFNLTLQKATARLEEAAPYPRAAERDRPRSDPSDRIAQENRRSESLTNYG